MKTLASIARHAPLALALFTLGGTALAQSGPSTDTRQVVRFGIGLFAPTGNFNDPLDLGKNEFKTTLGIGASYEFRVAPPIGVEFGFRYFQPKVEAGPYSDRGRFLPLTAGVNYHFDMPRLKLYAGPELAYVLYGNPNVPGMDFKNELTWGVKAGADIPWKNDWSFNVSVEYLGAKGKRNDAADIEPKPIIVQGGLAFRF